jgi:hypothetical protein
MPGDAVICSYSGSGGIVDTAYGCGMATPPPLEIRACG